MRNIRQIQIKSRSITHVDSTLQNCQGHDKQGKPEKLSETGETMGTWWLSAMWDPGCALGTEGGH